jgi:MSHA biogenesis protein MshP
MTLRTSTPLPLPMLGQLRQKTQRGFAAIAAIFLVVLLAALGSFMVSFSNTQQITSAQDLAGSRAYWAARGGLEMTIAVALVSNTICPNTAPTSIASPPAALNGYTLQIICSSNTYTDGGTTRTIVRIESIARSPSTSTSVGSLGYIERSVSASLEK